jgi:uncharacterized protein YggE
MSESGPRSLFLLALLLSIPVCARAQSGSDDKPVIVASGHGEAQAQANQASISLAIDTPGDTADEALKANAAEVATITQALKPHATSKGDSIQIANLSINPDYSNQGQSLKKTKSYNAGRRLTVIVPAEDLTLAGDVGTIATTDPRARLAGTDNDSTPGKIRVIIDYSSNAPTLAEAVQATIQGTRKLSKSIEAKLNGQGTIETEDSFGENSLPVNPMQSGPQGYVAHSTMTINLDRIDDVGSVTDAAVKAGASRLNSVTFSIANSDGLRDQAIAAATRDAQLNARAQAAALNLKLGPLIKSATGPPSFPYPVPAVGMMRTGRANGPPVNPGEVTNSAEVTLTYATQ